MKGFVLLVIFSVIAFLIYKVMYVLFCKLIRRCMKTKTDEKFSRFDLNLSIAMQLIFISTWVTFMEAVNQRGILDSLSFYVSFCLIGVFCIIWCYFSWDAEHFFVKPRKASHKEKKSKKIIVYSLIMIFVLCQGYFQTLHAMKNEIEVNVLFSVTNYSVIVAAIALDRVLNQFFS